MGLAISYKKYSPGCCTCPSAIHQWGKTQKLWLQWNTGPTAVQQISFHRQCIDDLQIFGLDLILILLCMYFCLLLWTSYLDDFNVSDIDSCGVIEMFAYWTQLVLFCTTFVFIYWFVIMSIFHVSHQHKMHAIKMHRY